LQHPTQCDIVTLAKSNSFNASKFSKVIGHPSKMLTHFEKYKETAAAWESSIHYFLD